MSVHILHVLPHRGGGAETFIDALERMPAYSHERIALSSSRSPVGAACLIPIGYPRLAARARRADLVHAHGDVAAVLSLPLMLETGAVWSSHGLHFLRRSSGMRRRLFAAGVCATIASSAWTICCSESERAELARVAMGRHAQRMVIVDNAVDPPRLPPHSEVDALRKDFGIRAGELSVLFVGQLETRKGVLDAVRAVQRARHLRTPVVLLVAGEGPLAEAVAAAGDGVRLLGYRRDLETLYAAADVFVMPSEREGLSFAVMEAMVRGIPTIATDVPGNREAVEGAGVLVPFGRSDALADVLVRLAREPEERARIGSACRARAEARFTLERFHRRMRELYESALGSDHGAWPSHRRRRRFNDRGVR
jgi:glycosyltransferase involved in cell wall biosynthesis